MNSARNSLRVAVVVGAVAMVAASAWAQGPGRSLLIEPGARQNGMGAAGVALLGDPTDATWWNPAALGFAHAFGAQWTTATLVPGLAEDVRYDHAGAAIPIRGFGGIGVAGTWLAYGRSGDFNDLGQYGSAENSGSISVGYRPLRALGIGVTAKYVRIELAPGSRSGGANTVGFDFGGLYRRSTKLVTLGFGVNVQNIGRKLSFVNVDQDIPLSRNLKLGAAIESTIPLRAVGYEWGVLAVGDINQSLVQGLEEFRTWHGGVEVFGAHGRWARLMLRGGYYHDGLGDIRDFTYGGGLRVAGATFDIAWIPQPRDSDLDDLMKMTLGFHSDVLGSVH